ncbi:DUF1796 family putative cysteine peptidase [Paenibacillus sp. MAH-36]|uniref:DUF1796 family putative cysteine peptidase n=2 Tax=Paenibacillus TaxID=44249 RepID=A0ABU3RIY6_9BACL|nr:DUF1796 family putative cysteine peptidase [Paenibacillus sp. PFR10]MDU0204225.1 DUF1796 family putative cysteine peptidase [Paenibacillus sp. PFR10]
MNLHELNRTTYDLVASLGQNCDPAGHLRRHKLRKFSMPLDWVISTSLTDVNRLLANKFQGFMDLSNLRVVEGSSQYVDEFAAVVQKVPSYFIKDTHYNVTSVHDFPIIPNESWYYTYHVYKAKLNLRIRRFLEESSASNSSLFVRLLATYDQAAELQSVLREITKGDFKILIVNPIANLERVMELDWGLDHVCVVQIPSTNNLKEWDYILTGLKIKL